VRPPLLLVDADAARRLRLITALCADYEVIVPAPGEDPLRLARGSRPEVCLLAVGGGARSPALRLCRVLKTDVRSVPAVGLYAPVDELGPSAAAVHAALADGYCASGDSRAILAFTGRLRAGERPLPEPWPEPPRGPVRRALNRLLGGPPR
jgi:hypothetical protein